MDLAEMAQRQLDDYDRHRPGLLFADDAFSLTVEQAYELQIQVAALRRRRGESVAGYKVGCVSESIRRQLGLSHPVFGHIFASELHASGCVLDPARYEGLAIEGEFAARIAGDLAVSSLFQVIELHNYIFRGAAQTAQELIANNAMHAGVVLPAEEPPCEDVRHEPISVCINGALWGSAEDGAMLDGIRFLVENLEHFGIRLRPGQIVLTGSPLPLYRVQEGDRIEVRCRRLPAVTAAIGRSGL